MKSESQRLSEAFARAIAFTAFSLFSGERVVEVASNSSARLILLLSLAAFTMLNTFIQQQLILIHHLELRLQPLPEDQLTMDQYDQ